ncbi:MAG TPA: hypothetical protein VFX98_04940 [Longimicrobiaceae bacterium]|nr:hypothetical protein [Longimicrobiaceae bacterium]
MADGDLRALAGVRLPGRRGSYTVELARGRVERIGPYHGPEPSPARGLLLLPALADAHVHLTFLPPAAGAEMARAGVLSVRDVGGECARVAAWAAAAGPLAPRVEAYGEPLDGTPPEPRAAAFGARGVSTAAEVEAHLDHLAREGAAGLKLYFGFPPELVAGAVAGAHARGLRVAAHLGSGTLPGFHGISPQAFAEAGGDTVEHVHSFTAAVLAPDQRAVRQDLPSLSRVFLAWSQCDPGAPHVLEAIDRFAATGCGLVPTLSVLALMPGCIPLPGVADPRVEQLGEDPRFAYVREGFARMLEFVGIFHARGGRLIAGTDLATDAAGVSPGGALPLELRLLRRAGISAAEVLCAASGHAVEPGAPADFVLAHAADEDDFLDGWRVEAVVRQGAVVHGRLPADVHRAA